MRIFVISVSLLILSGCAYNGHLVARISGDKLRSPYGKGDNISIEITKTRTFLWFWNKPKG